MSLTVLGSPLSPYVRKVTVSLRLKEVEFQLDHTVSPFSIPDGFEKLNPLKRIPVLKHEDRAIADSGVICRYLDSVFPQHKLSLDDPYLQSQVDWFEKFADYELAPLLTFQAFRLLLLFPVMQREVDTAQVHARLDKELPPLLNYLEEQIGDNDYLVGNQFTLADLAVVSQFICYHYSGEQIDRDRWPNLSRYLDYHFQSPVFAAILDKELGLVAKMRAKAGL
ncbi:glutathione S-transferase family protein [Porticoccaceae bacterium LTM1]|nr:glutathione S-transferase family protein [Porticoccaceae bacterium LTM1]